MAKSIRVPSYRLHKPTGQAVVTLSGRDRYLGKHGSEASREKYRRLLAAHLGGTVESPPADENLSCGEVVKRYLRFASKYYRKSGEPTTEVASIRCALRFVAELHGSRPAASFDVIGLREVREAMIQAGHARTSINRNVGRVVRCFRWAVTEKLYPGTLLAELQALPGLRRGRCAAAESEPVEPIADAIVNATLPHLSPQIADMVRLQRVTGMRPNEVCVVRPCDVDRSGDVWVYEPAAHKTEHHGKTRTIFIGPRGQEILRPYLLRPGDEFCFRSNRAAAIPRKQRRYRRDTYYTAIQRGCVKAGVEPWSPNRLRHTYATEVRREHGLEAAQVLLGHSTAAVTQIYAERDHAKGAEVARRSG